MTKDHIPASALERTPLLTPEGWGLLKSLREHPHAPAWNYEVGDRLVPGDLEALDAFRADLAAQRKPFGATPPPRILEWLEKQRHVVPLLEHLLQGLDPAAHWDEAPSVTRAHIAERPEELASTEVLRAPQGLDRLIVYDTSGTTGHSLNVPHHPLAMAAYLPLMELALGRYGVTPDLGPHRVSHVNLSARAACVTFAAVLTAWNQAGFAKLNLNASQWRNKDQIRRFLADISPQLVAGDPVSLAELLAWNIPAKPRLALSTAATLEPALKARLERGLGCPVMDWYSTTETGPVAYACNHGHFHVLPHDLFVEALDEQGRTTSGRGNLAVTGGRNPFLPLLRYRTGDQGRMEFAPCPCGDPMPRIMDLSARKQVLFLAADGSKVNQADVALALREFLHARHRLVQRPDRSLMLTLRPVEGWPVPLGQVQRKLSRLFGGLDLHVASDPHLDHKALAYERQEPDDADSA